MNIQNIVALEEVKEDLMAGSSFYELQSYGLGEYFRDCIISDMESLRLYAGIHERHNDCYRMLSKRFPYAIYYDIQDDTAVILAVLDMRRDPSWIHSKVIKRNTK